MKGNSNELGLFFWACVAVVAWMTGSLGWLILAAICSWIAYHIVREQVNGVNASYFDVAIGTKMNQLALTPEKYAEKRQELTEEIAKLRAERAHAEDHAKTIAGLAGIGVFASPIVGGIALGVGMNAVRKEAQAAADAQVDTWKAIQASQVDTNTQQRAPINEVEAVGEQEEEFDEEEVNI
jgi:hypothetical protein